MAHKRVPSKGLSVCYPFVIDVNITLIDILYFLAQYMEKKAPVNPKVCSNIFSIFKTYLTIILIAYIVSMLM